MSVDTLDKTDLSLSKEGGKSIEAKTAEEPVNQIDTVRSGAGIFEVEADLEGDPREDGDGEPPSAEVDNNCDDESDDAAAWDEVSRGRYFGPAEDAADSGPLCHNCKQPGHKKKDCPHQLCRSCGALDDHDTMRCPMTQRCYNCSRLGHLASKCPEPQRQHGSFCKECGSKSHLDRSCPQIWRLYLPSSTFKADGDWEVTAYCYNCAAAGHYGDDCPRPHRARLIEPSAFCQANQPESRSDRAKREKKKDLKDPHRHRWLDKEEHEDDWFARQREPIQSGFQPSSSYNSFQSGNNPHSYPPTAGSRRPRHDDRYDPYARPANRGPVITSERYPRGLPSASSSSAGYKGYSSSQAQPRRSYEKRKPVPAAQRLFNQSQPSGQSFRGGKAYRGGCRR